MSRFDQSNDKKPRLWIPDSKKGESEKREIPLSKIEPTQEGELEVISNLQFGGFDVARWDELVNKAKDGTLIVKALVDDTDKSLTLQVEELNRRQQTQILNPKSWQEKKPGNEQR